MTEFYLIIFVAAAAGLAFFLLRPEKKTPSKGGKKKGKNERDTTKIYNDVTKKVGPSRVHKNK
ncbi:MAG: hypothetical protein IJ265_00450 [Oscillospiraceae bacterium]|nr:hypothetical protein [Oscillospiraceae bacterium]